MLAIMKKEKISKIIRNIGENKRTEKEIQIIRKKIKATITNNKSKVLVIEK